VLKTDREGWLFSERLLASRAKIAWAMHQSTFPAGLSTVRYTAETMMIEDIKR
jgi:hypothetical protein